MMSRHRPFSNDAHTRITTCLLPLGKGYHLRAHRVELSQRYRVVEGGFSVGRWNDREVSTAAGDWTAIASDAGYSWMCTYTPELVELGARPIHPGMHLYFPMAKYPCFSTRTELDEGVYIFISCFFYSSRPERWSGADIRDHAPQVRFLAEDRSKFCVVFDGEEFMLELWGA